MSFPVRRRLLRSLIAAGAALAMGAATADEARPLPPLRLLVGFPAGGGTDAIARLLAEQLKQEIGAPVLVENKPGAGGQIAAQMLKASPPDGHTFFLSHDHTISILPLVVKKPGFEPAVDFVPVAGFASFVNAFAVSGGTPATSLEGYVAWVREKGGGQGAVGVPAPASVPEFLVKVLADGYRLDLISAPYRGSAPMIADMLGNQIAAGIGSVPDFIEQHRHGKLRVVAVLGDRRQAAMPEVPTLAELGVKGFEDVPYYGFFAPKGTPQASIDGFSIALAKSVATPAVRDRLTAMGLTVEFMPQADLARREQAYRRTWAAIIAKSGFQPD